jgi:hypothetical protein
MPQGRADPVPGQLATAGLGHPGAQVVVHLVAHRLDARQVVEESLVLDLLPHRHARRWAP